MTSETVPFQLVDAFAERAFNGNAAGVVLQADGLDEGQMQAMAREVNASETAFIVGGNDLHRPPKLRWFSPTIEVGFCGHATLAAAHGWASVVGRERIARSAEGALVFDTKAGMLRVKPESLPNRPADTLWWLSMPDPSLKADNINPIKTCEYLGITIDDLEPAAPIMRTRDDDLILLIKSWQRLVEMRPNMQALADWSRKHKVRGMCVSTRQALSDSIDAVSRFFAPAAGIPEDPVTGSVHGGLAVLLVLHELVPFAGGRAALNCIQGEPGGRTGLVRALVEQTPQGYRVQIGGMCQTTVRGEMTVPAAR